MRRAAWFAGLPLALACAAFADYWLGAPDCSCYRPTSS
jgi:hypothetical protein